MNREEVRKEKERLLKQIVDMTVTGYTQEEIAKQLRITRRTVANYIDKSRKQIIKEMRGNPEEQIARMEQDKAKRLKKLWGIVLDPTSKKRDITSAVKLIQKEEELAIRRRQIVGMLPRDNPMIAIQNNHTEHKSITITDTVQKHFPELIERFKLGKVRNEEE